MQIRIESGVRVAERTELAAYIESMRGRFPRLSKRAMAIDAGLSGSTVANIINYGGGASQETCRRLAETWGRTQEEKTTDYRELMSRAGYDVPRERELSDEEQALLERYKGLTDEQQQLIQGIWNQLPPDSIMAGLQQLAGELEPPDLDAVNATLEDLLSAVLSLPSEERQRWICRSLRDLLSGSETGG